MRRKWNKFAIESSMTYFISWSLKIFLMPLQIMINEIISNFWPFFVKFIENWTILVIYVYIWNICIFMKEHAMFVL